ncbi:hypothetical protein [Paenibacillus larvae]
MEEYVVSGKVLYFDRGYAPTGMLIMSKAAKRSSV